MTATTNFELVLPAAAFLVAGAGIDGHASTVPATADDTGARGMGYDDSAVHDASARVGTANDGTVLCTAGEP